MPSILKRILLPQTSSWKTGIGLVLAIVVLGLWFQAAPSFWETNDDPAMALLVVGEGLADQPTAQLVFSNLLWGKIIQALPPFGGWNPYDLAHALALSLAVIFLSVMLMLLTGHTALVILLLILSTARAFLFPQFTLSAGLLTATAILGLVGGQGQTGVFIFSVLLGWLGFLIRPLEFVFVCLVALPFLSFSRLKHDRKFLAAWAVLILGCGVAFQMDRLSYQTSEWEKFRRQDWIRAQLTDFSVGERLKRQPEVLARHGYSKNDISLLQRFFFADSQLADVQRLEALLKEAEEIGFSFKSPGKGAANLMDLLEEPWIYFLLWAVFWGWALPEKRRWMAAWVVFFSLLFLLGAGGRPHVSRSYCYALMLLTWLPLLSWSHQSVKVKAVAMAGAAALLMVLVPPLWQQGQVESEKVQSFQNQFQQIVNQGFQRAWMYADGFPLELMSPAFADRKPVPFEILGIGALMPAPYSRSREGRAGESKFVAEILGSEGAEVFLRPQDLTDLFNYCREHFGKTLRIVVHHEESRWMLANLRCQE